ncbi:protease complex subunit PrcB family protein [Aureibacter tunicatorum]|uniref:PrcB C-terminal domain-containing protein n=1 Tax=Aureibacter tunicatorum TaxID=866807 RepID=A0AAE4BTL7_9BACT|nr:protease complex subunit PrcB family protein [Aureibacter tunicatorum]MDR6239772.1 hypothetical protein [Aureibacter tunicatorum]BDD04247.1 hypothetical protein AUTU_17300 [Aureibacter tunicatorum]
MRNLLLMLMSVMLLSCSDSQTQSKNFTAVDIAQGNLLGAGEEGIQQENVVIKDEKSWNELLKKMDKVNDVSSHFSRQKVDFNKNMIIASFEGVKSSGGYGIALKVKPDSDKIIVEVKRISPEGMASMQMTQPYHIIEIPKSNLPVEFVNVD